MGPGRRSRADLTYNVRWFPLVGGLGWGRIRISLLFKPVDIQLARGITGYEVATLQLTSLSLTATEGIRSEKGFGVIIETESDKYELSSAGADEPNISSKQATNNNYNALGSPSRVTLDHLGGGGASSSRLSFSSANLVEATELEWDLSPRRIRLAVQYRHSCSLLISLVSRRSGVLKKRKKVLGLALVYLGDCEDGQEVERRDVPVFSGDDVVEVMRAVEEWKEDQSCARHPGQGMEYGGDHKWEQDNLAESSTSTGGTNLPENTEAPSTPGRMNLVRSASSSSKRSSRSSRSHRQKPSESVLLGFVNISFILHPGVSKAHRRLAKRDTRFAKVYEVWESGKEVQSGVERLGVVDGLRDMAGNDVRADGNGNDSSEDDDEEGEGNSEDEESESGDGDGDETRNEVRRLAGRSTGSRASAVGASAKSKDPRDGNREIDEEGEEDDGKDEKAGWRAHQHALHKRVRCEIVHCLRTL